MKLTEKTLSSTAIFSGRIFSVRNDVIELPNGRQSRREIVHHNGGVCCAAVNKRDELAFVTQYRYAYGKTLLELPAGKLEPNEDPFDAIKRELSEEIGANGKNWRSLGCIYPTPGYVDEVIHLFSCDIDELNAPHPDEGEFLEISYIPLRKALAMAMRGELCDAKTLILIQRLALERGILPEGE